MSHKIASRGLAPAGFLLLLGGTALAQSPPANPTGARPGNVIGTGQSLPRSNQASNLPGSTAHSKIAPNLPSPPLPSNANPEDFLRAARTALAAGKTGEAQQSLEMAKTRALSRPVPAGQTNVPSQDPLVASISDALRALGTHNRPATLQAIDAAIASAGHS